MQSRGCGQRRLYTALAAVCLASFVLPEPAAASLFRRSPYEAGQQVTVQGVVRDAKGQPLGDLRVTLEASRTGFSLYPWGNHKREVATGSAHTTAAGEFGLQFPWNGHFTHFELVVAVPVATAQGEDQHELWRDDITRRVQQGSPVAVPVELADTAFLETLRQFLGSLRTDEERNTYRQVGRPDRVDNTSYPDRLETAWWYFRAGKVYRFRDGRLEKVEEFSPVQPVS
ncbi:MAG TPA: hypothetical protein VFS60_03880 [Thermoanaerobaculia bacterium]|nr:hypothetical protein [Thermoanaerobaculia bacterium]